MCVFTLNFKNPFINFSLTIQVNKAAENFTLIQYTDF